MYRAPAARAALRARGAAATPAALAAVPALRRLLGRARRARCSRRPARFAETVLEPLNRSGDLEGARWTPEGVLSGAGLPRRLPAVRRRRLAAARRPPGVRRPARCRCVLVTAVEEIWGSANLAFKLCPMLTHGAVHALELCGSPRAEAPVSAEDGQRRVDRHDGAHRAAGRLGPRRRSARARCPRAITTGSSARRSSSPGAITTCTPNIIHMVLARIDGAPAGRQGHLAVHRAEVPGERRRHARGAQRRALRVDRAQARHPREPHLRAGLRREATARSATCVGEAESRPRIHVHHDERGAPVGGHARATPSASARSSRRPSGRAPACRASRRCRSRRVRRRSSITRT